MMINQGIANHIRSSAVIWQPQEMVWMEKTGRNETIRLIYIYIHKYIILYTYKCWIGI